MSGLSLPDEPPEEPEEGPGEDPRDPDAWRDDDEPTGLDALREEGGWSWDLHHTNPDGSLAEGVRKCPHCWGPAFTDNPVCPLCHFKI